MIEKDAISVVYFYQTSVRLHNKENLIILFFKKVKKKSVGINFGGVVEADVGYSDDGWEVCGKVVSKEKASNNRQLNHTFKKKREKNEESNERGGSDSSSIGLFLLLYYTKFDRFLNQTGGSPPLNFNPPPTFYPPPFEG